MAMVAALMLLSAPVAQACGLGIESGKWEAVETAPEQFGGVPLIEGDKNVNNLKEVASVYPEEHKGVSVTTADVFAHKGYAYLGTHVGSHSNEGVRVFDLSHPEDPQEVSVFANDLPGTWQEKVIVKSVNTPHFKGDLAAVSVQKYRQDQTKSGGVLLYDVSNPEEPEQLGFWELPEEVRTGTHELYLTQQGNRVLVLAANIYADYYTDAEFHDFAIVDVTNPSEPEMVYNWDPREILTAEDYDGYTYTDEEGAQRYAFAHSVITDQTGQYAYISFWDLGTVIMDISEPESPEVVGHTQFERHVQGAAHSAALAKGGTVLIETREVFNPDPHDEQFERGWGYTRIFDIKDKSNPKLIGDFRTMNSMIQIEAGEREPGTFTVHDPKVRGNTLYLSHYTDGVRMVDITDPSNPVEVGSYVSDPALVWGVFVDRQYILASDMNDGLKVLLNNAGQSSSSRHDVAMTK